MVVLVSSMNYEPLIYYIYLYLYYIDDKECPDYHEQMPY